MERADPNHSIGKATESEIARVNRELEPKQRLFLLIGPPLSGKSLAAGFIQHTYEGLPHRGLSDMIRGHIRDEMPFADAAKRETYTSYLEKMNQGELLPSRFVNNFIVSCLRNNPEGLVLDGYPRTPGQLRFLQELTKDWKNPPAVLELNFNYKDSTELNARLNKRVADAKLLGEVRVDDTPRIIRKRIGIYEELTSEMFVELVANPGRMLVDRIEFQLTGKEPKAVKKEVVGKLAAFCDGLYQRKED